MSRKALRLFPQVPASTMLPFLVGPQSSTFCHLPVLLGPLRLFSELSVMRMSMETSLETHVSASEWLPYSSPIFAGNQAFYHH